MPFFHLSTKGFKNISWDLLNNDFRFIIDKPYTEFPVNTILAEFISPDVSLLHQSDVTIDQYHIKSANPELFMQIIQILKGDPIEVDHKNVEDLIEIASDLGNQELIEILETLKIESLSTDTIVDCLLSSNTRNFKINDKFIQFAAENFEIIPIEKLSLLSSDILSLVASHKSFSITSEDSFFQIVLELFQKDDTFVNLFEYVIFQNLSNKSLQQFVESVSFEYINVNIWSHFSSIVNPKSNSLSRKRYKSVLYNHNNSCESLFDGIINYLSCKYHKKILDLNIIKITSSSVNKNFPLRVPQNTIDYESPNYFQSNNESNSWICFDFMDNRISPTGYSIKSRPDFGVGSDHLKSWKLEASNDNSNWITLDIKDNIQTLNSQNASSLFNFNSSDNQFYRYLRIIATEPMISGFNNMTIAAIEFFGYFREFTNSA